MAVASIEVGHLLGVPVVVPGLATDAKHPGVQTGYEKALKALAVCEVRADMLSGGVGMLDASIPSTCRRSSSTARSPA